MKVKKEKDGEVGKKGHERKMSKLGRRVEVLFVLWCW